jgi:hypothetical protein
VYLPNRHLSAKVRVFIDFLVERFAAPPYWDRDWTARAMRAPVAKRAPKARQRA